MLRITLKNKSVLFKLLVLIILFSGLPLTSSAQISGVVTDASTHEQIVYPSISYKKKKVSTSGNEKGYYTIQRINGEVLTFTAVGYKPFKIRINDKTPEKLDVALANDTRQLNEVVIKRKGAKYNKKNNPAVLLMQRVITAKHRNNISNHDFYRYNEYQKMTLAFNDIKSNDIDSGFIGKNKWLLNQIEYCDYNKKLILPISVDETVKQHFYRKHPKNEKEIITGKNTVGVNELIQTGDILNNVVKDLFTNIDLYEDQINLLQKRFISPIADGAIDFYRYYIEDTIAVDNINCYHLQFIPNNPQDFGFRGEIYITADSALQVKKCNLTLPKNTGVNFIEELQIRQEFTKLDNHEWILSVDDMIVEVAPVKKLPKAIVIRTTRYTDYAFNAIPEKQFKGKTKVITDANSMMQNKEFWNKYRTINLTKSEQKMGGFIKGLEQTKGFKYILFVAKALIENFIETGNESHPSKIDLGPMNTLLTRNFIDGWRSRISLQSTANLHSHVFFSGYLAHGWRSNKNYYKGELTYSFNRKNYSPYEFPKRTLTFTSTYDIMSPSDMFMKTDKDNVFTSMKWAKVDKMMFYNRQKINFEWEEEWGLTANLQLKTEENQAAGSLHFIPLSAHQDYPQDAGIDANTMLNNGKIRTTEASIYLKYIPGRTYMNTKQRRIAVNKDAPEFTLNHIMGFKGVLGGQYNYHLTQIGTYKRFWLDSYGQLDLMLEAGVQWCKVPYPLLTLPPANLSYIIQTGTFGLINNMEFLNDRYAICMCTWDLNGKLFNRIPLLNRLRLRELLSVRTLWGDLTRKNNPTLSVNADDPILMVLPTGSHLMHHRIPYVEVAFGIHNIFKILHVEYVRRLSYNHLPTAHKHGVRLKMRVEF